LSKPPPATGSPATGALPVRTPTARLPRHGVTNLQLFQSVPWRVHGPRSADSCKGYGAYLSKPALLPVRTAVASPCTDQLAAPSGPPAPNAGRPTADICIGSSRGGADLHFSHSRTGSMALENSGQPATQPVRPHRPISGLALEADSCLGLMDDCAESPFPPATAKPGVEAARSIASKDSRQRERSQRPAGDRTAMAENAAA